MDDYSWGGEEQRVWGRTEKLERTGRVAENQRGVRSREGRDGAYYVEEG